MKIKGNSTHIVNASMDLKLYGWAFLFKRYFFVQWILGNKMDPIWLFGVSNWLYLVLGDLFGWGQTII